MLRVTPDMPLALDHWPEDTVSYWPLKFKDPKINWIIFQNNNHFIHHDILFWPTWIWLGPPKVVGHWPSWATKFGIITTSQPCELTLGLRLHVPSMSPFSVPFKNGFDAAWTCNVKNIKLSAYKNGDVDGTCKSLRIHGKYQRKFSLSRSFSVGLKTP